MEELNNKEENKIPKKLIIIIVIIVFTALIAGSLVYFWLKTRIAQEKESLEVKLENLQEQFDQTYAQYQKLIAQKEEQDSYEDWQTYRNDEHGYKVKYPNDWRVYYSSGEEPPYYVPLKAKSYFHALEDKKVTHFISIEASDSKWENMLSALNIKNTLYERFIIDGYNAVKVENLRQGKTYIRVAINGPKGIVYDLQAEKEQPYLGVFNLMLSTFKFIEPIDTSTWQTYQNEEYGFEFKYPEKNKFEPSRSQDDLSTIFCYLLEEWATPKSAEGTACLWTGYISQDQLNVMGITYCGAYPEDSRCESLTINQHIGFTIDWGIEVPGTNQMKASAWITHPEGGIVTLDLQPVVPKSKDLFKQILSTFKLIDPVDTSTWQTYQNEKYGFEFEYSRNLILDDYDEESVGKVCYGCWKKTVVLKNEKENYSIYFNIYTNDNYDLCKSQLYNEHDLNEIGRGEYKVVSTENKLFLFSKSIELENIFKDGELNCIQSQCQQIQDLVTSVHLSASDLDDFVLRNSDDVIQQANQILSTFKLIDPVDTSTWQTYRNEEAGFTLEYPKEWGLIEKETYRKSIPPAPGEVFYIIFESNFSISGVTENYEPYESPLSVYTGGNPYKFCQDFNKEVFPLENCRKINDNISILTYGYYEEQGMFGTGEEIRFYIDAFIDNKLNKYKGITISYEFPEYFNNELVNMDINEIKNIAEKHSDQLNENSLSKFNQAITTFKFIE